MELFILTLRFLTIINIPFKTNKIFSNNEFSKGIIYYPIVGIIIGFINFIVFKVTIILTGSLIISSIFSVLSNIIITGGFHIDGIADTCDGFYSSRDRKRILEIMRDSRVGTNGAIGIFFDIIIRICSIYVVGYEFGIKKCIFVIVISPIVSKMVMPILFNSKYARNGDGLGNIYLTDKYSIRSIITILIGFLIITLFFKNYISLVITFVCILSAIIYKSHCKNIICGMTGDTLGAGSEIIEIVYMICYIIILNIRDNLL